MASIPEVLAQRRTERELANIILGGIQFGPAPDQHARAIEAANEVRRVMRERELLKKHVADLIGSAVAAAKVMDRPFFDSLAEHVLRLTEGR